MGPGRYYHIDSTSNDGVVVAAPASLKAVVVNKAATGQTLSIHDCAAEADAAAGNLVAKVALEAAVTLEYGAKLDHGLVAVLSAGAPDITVIWG